MHQPRVIEKFRTPDMGTRIMSGFQCRSFGAETSAPKKKWPKAALILEILKITAHEFRRPLAKGFP